MGAVFMPSPFRYPGGKARLAPRLAPWFQRHRASLLLEPFAGGASVSLHAVACGWVKRAVLVEKDPAIAAFWRYVLRAQSRVKLIATIKAIADPVACAVAGPGVGDDLSAAVWAICRNRTSFGGVITANAGLASEKNGRSATPRWNRDGLVRRIEAIGGIASRLTIIEGEALDVLRAERQSAAFIDPPYPRVGKSLYRHHVLDHEALLHEVAARPVAVATYNKDRSILASARRLGLSVEPFTIKGNSRTSEEILIGTDLDWWQPQGFLFPTQNNIAPLRNLMTAKQGGLSHG